MGEGGIWVANHHTPHPLKLNLTEDGTVRCINIILLLSQSGGIVEVVCHGCRHSVCVLPTAP